MSATPVQIILESGDHSFTLDHEALTEILLKNEVRNRDLVIISVAGAFRKGKSFMLDFFLRYLYSRVSFNHFNQNLSESSSIWLNY